MPDLPRPRDREELIARIRIYLASGGLFNPELADHDAVRDLLMDCREALMLPPVSEASPEGMPELALEESWAVIRRSTGKVWHAPFSTPEAAERARKQKTSAPPEDLVSVRLAVVEVVEPEPETAPSGWRYEVKRTPHARRWSLRADGASGSWWTYENEPRSALIDAPYIPPIDREYVARLLGGNDAE